MSAQNIRVRPSTEADIDDILRLIKELADYEKALDKVEATPALLKQNLFPPPGKERYAHCLVAEQTSEDGRKVVVAMALYFFNFSTWQAQPGLYLEDLYCTPAIRGKGVGKMLFRELGKIALERGCGRVQWQVIDWNQPAIDFYEKAINAKITREWLPVRLEGEAEIRGLANLP